MLAYLKIIFKGFVKFRKKRKNLTLVLSGAFFLIFFLISLSQTLFYNVREYWGKMLLGDGAIVSADYDNYKALKPFSKDYYFSNIKIKEHLKDINNVNFSPRLRFFALVEGYRNEHKQGMVLIGSEEEKEQAIISNVRLTEGRFPLAGEKGICLYYKSAGPLDVDLGDTVIVYVQNVNGYMDCDLLTVTGLLEPKKVQDFYPGEFIGYVPLSFAASIMGLPKDAVSEVVFSSTNYLKKRWLKFLIPPQFKIIDLWHSEEIPLTMRYLYVFIFSILLILILGVVFSTVYHNISLMIVRRFREIGVFLTFGASKWWIFLLFSGELFFYVIYCSLLGTFISILLILGINSLKIQAMNAKMEVFMCSPQFVISLKPEYFIFSFILLWLIILSASFIPVFKGVNQSIIVKLFRR